MANSTSNFNTSNSTHSKSIVSHWPKFILNPDAIDIIIYHKNCFDGFAGAWSAWKYNQQRYQYFNSTAGPSGFFPLRQCENKNVLCIDYCFTWPRFLQMQKACNTLLVLDHHITNQTTMEAHSNEINTNKVQLHFDMNSSGSKLAWKFFHGSKPIPDFIKLIDDHDLGKWKLDETHAFISFLQYEKFEFEVYDKFFQDKKAFQNAITKGNVINQVHEKDIEKFQGTKVDNFFGYSIIIANGSILKNQLANALLNKHTDASFVLVWSYNHSKKSCVCSLRSANVDVSILAKKFNGGGHKTAAAFIFNGPIDDLLAQSQKETLSLPFMTDTQTNASTSSHVNNQY